MPALGQKQTLHRSNGMSAFPPKADIAERNWDVRFVPIADIGHSFDHLVGGESNAPSPGNFKARS
jgi:hypothetical protein